MRQQLLVSYCNDELVLRTIKSFAQKSLQRISSRFNSNVDLIPELKLLTFIEYPQLLNGMLVRLTCV